MKYLIVQKWKNTEKNHAGMYHLCNLMLKENPGVYKVIAVPDLDFTFKNIFIKKIYHVLIRIFLFFLYLLISFKLIFLIKKGDKIILFEYLTPGIRQDIISGLVHFFASKKCKVFCIVHLTPRKLSLTYSKRTIQKRIGFVDGVITLGSSLKVYLESIVDKPIVTLKHYADLRFYNLKEREFGKVLNVLIIGQQERDYQRLIEFISSNSYVNYHIVSSNIAIVNTLKCFDYVSCYMSVEEEELFQIMNKCEVSLNFMYDVVGSNVISTCISLGIVSLVSDVGSIRDYLSENDTLFCKTYSDFSHNLKIIDANRTLLSELRKHLIEKRYLLSFKLFEIDLNKFISSI